MAEETVYLSVRERICAKLLAIVDAITGIGDVERWDQRGNSQGHLSAVLYFDGHDDADGGTSPVDIVTVTMPMRVELVIAIAEADTAIGDELQNTWIAKIVAAVMADQALNESEAGPPLANRVKRVGVLPPLAVDGQPNMTINVLFEIEWDEYANNPYAGPGVTAVEVPELEP